MSTRRTDIAAAAWGLVEPVTSPWRSGDWAADLRGDEVAELSWRGVPLLRAVRIVARDAQWGTVPAAVRAVRPTDDGVLLTLDLIGLGADLDATLRLRATGRRLEVGARIVARRAWRRARLGLVVLHPPDLAGTALVVRHPDGSEELGAFPDRIAPHQPATRIAGLAWRRRGVDVRLEFAGEVFEMEDQRNWTDASFKTYGTPLDLPTPVEVAAGEVIEQAVTIVVAGSPQLRPSGRRPVRLEATGARFPRVGVASSTDPDAPTATGAPGAFRLAEVDLDAPGWRTAITRISAETRAAGVPLDMRLVTCAPDAIAEAVEELRDADVARIGVAHGRRQVTEPDLWAALRSSLASGGLAAVPVAGARGHFTELNRRIEALPDDARGLFFSLTPQAHAIESAHLEESLAIQRLVAQNAVALAAGRPVHIGPVTLRPRYRMFSPAPGGATPAGVGFAVAPDGDDPRQRSTALAAWTVASAAALAIPGVESLTYFETWGPRGLRDAAGAFPVEAAVARLAAVAGAELLAADGEPDDGARLLAVRHHGTPVVLLANPTPRAVHRDVDGLGSLSAGPYAVEGSG